eukprot:4706152-Amphidinium_carterae.1
MCRGQGELGYRDVSPNEDLENAGEAATATSLTLEQDVGNLKTIRNAGTHPAPPHRKKSMKHLQRAINSAQAKPAQPSASMPNEGVPTGVASQ